MFIVDDLTIILMVLIGIRFLGFLVFIELLLRHRESKYGVLALAWLAYTAGPVCGLEGYLTTGDADHPLFGYFAAVGTWLLMGGVLAYYRSVSSIKLYTMISLIIIVLGLAVWVHPVLSGALAVLAQLIFLLATLFIIVFKRKWFLTFGGNSYYWLLPIISIGLFHAFGFEFVYPGAPFSVRLFLTFLLNVSLLIFFLHFEYNQSLMRLSKSKEKFKELSNSLPQTVFETNEMGELSFVNNIAFEVFGYDKIDFDKGLNAIDMIAQHDRDRALKNMLSVMNGNDLGPSEYTALKKDGSTFPVMIHTTSIISEERSVGIRGIIIDLSKQKKLEIQLHQAQKLETVGTLAGGIAHDFNNILSSIIGYTELALDDVKKGSLLENNLQEVYTAGKRARDLVKQILIFARQSDEEQKPVRVDLIAEEVLKLIRSSIPSTIEIKKNIQSTALIMGNPTQVHQLFMNLCTNAAQAMEDAGGILEIGLVDVELNGKALLTHSTLKSGKYMALSVSDTGSGIAPDIIETIFEPYFTTKDPGEGTGMGLAMVHGIVETYGGKIMVDSRLGEGTVFTIYLPITGKRQEQRPYEPEDLPPGTERILFVDDELSIAKMGSQNLEYLGYSVKTRTSSVEALELFRNKPRDFDLVITDMTMPNMTGDTLAIELMKIRPDIPVIICTGYSKKISEDSIAAIGIKALAYKPVGKADLAKTVRKVLDEAKG